MRLFCWSCHKSVSTEVSDDTVVRACCFCPECIESGKAGAAVDPSVPNPGTPTTREKSSSSSLAILTAPGGAQLGNSEFPIPLSEAQQLAAQDWAADDRLWTTQETVEFNLRTFARLILKLAAPGGAPPPLTQEEWADIEVALLRSPAFSAHKRAEQEQTLAKVRRLRALPAPPLSSGGEQ